MARWILETVVLAVLAFLVALIWYLCFENEPTPQPRKVPDRPASSQPAK